MVIDESKWISAHLVARQIRASVVNNTYRQGLIIKSEARELLCANLSPDDDSTFFDDSALAGDWNAVEKLKEAYDAQR